jgi:hypothetical protein
MDDLKLEALEKLLEELKLLILEIKASKPSAPELDLKQFFAAVRTSLFAGRISQSQVSGMEAKIRAFQEAQYPLSWAAYALATSYHETAQRMQPVREGLGVSDAWRQRNLRYYPYYGRGDVQLTWKANYEKADQELDLGGALINNLDLALDPDVSAKIMVRGMKEGWFTGKKLADYLPDKEGKPAQFKQARRIINLMDKADLIAGYAVKFQTALKEAGYGNSDNR